MLTFLLFLLNSKNGCLKHLTKYGIVGVNKGLFTNACKKALKYVHIATLKVFKIEAPEEELKDILVTIVRSPLVLNEDQNRYKKLFLKNIFYTAKH